MQNNKYQLEKEMAIKTIILLVILYFLPSGHGVVFWMSVGFAILGNIAYVVGVYRVRSLKPHGKSSIFEVELQKIVDIYIKVHVIGCIVFTLFGQWVPIWLPMLFYVTVIGCFVSSFESDDKLPKKEEE